MLRRALAPFVLAAVAGIALSFPLALRAQDPPKKADAPKEDAPKEEKAPVVVKVETNAPIVALAIKTTEGGVLTKNLSQYVCFEGLGQVGYVVDTRLDEKSGSPHDKWIRKALEKLLPKKPDGPFKIELPPASFVVEATVAITYKPTKFYEKDVTNNFEVHCQGEIQDGAGKKLKALDIKHYWGETPQTPRAKVRDNAEIVVAYCVLNELYSCDGFKEKVPAEKKAELEKALKFLKEQSETRCEPKK